MFIENDICIPWGCELRVDTINSEDARLLKDAGCQLVATGIESANEVVLKTNFKYQDPKKVKSGITNLKKYDILKLGNYKDFHPHSYDLLLFVF